MIADNLRRLADFLEWKQCHNFEPCQPATSLTLVRIERIMQINFPKADGSLTEIITATFKDAKGNPTTAHGTVTFASSDETIATVTPNADGISALVTGTGLVGTCTITGTDEKDNASDMATVTTAAGEATSMTLVDGDPAPGPAPVDPAPASSEQSADPVGGDGPTK